MTLLTSLAEAGEIQSVESIREVVHHFVEANIDTSQGDVVISVGKLDRRLRLSRCELPVEVHFSNSAKRLGNITVAARCEGVKPWSLMVPTRIKQFIEVVVATKPLGRSRVIVPGDAKLARTDISRLGGGYYATVRETDGMILKRSVAAGTVLTMTMLKPAILIKRGDKVIIRAETRSIGVAMEGQAIAAGVKGEMIKVKNLSSKQIIEAEVLSPGVVGVRM